MQGIHKQVPHDSGLGFIMFFGTNLVKWEYDISSSTDSHSDIYFICSIAKEASQYRVPSLTFCLAHK